MTNEQLTILIRGYALHLDELIKKLDDELPEGNERHLQWVRKNRKSIQPGSVMAIAANLHGTSDELEQIQAGDFVCLDGLRQFSAELWAQIDELSAAKELRTFKSRRAR